MQYTEYERNEDFYKKIFQMNVREKKNSYDIAEELNIPWGNRCCVNTKSTNYGLCQIKSKTIELVRSESLCLNWYGLFFLYAKKTCPFMKREDK